MGIKEEIGITRQQIISVLAKSPHGALKEYVPIGSQAAKEEPEFLAHLIAWNHQKGQIRDSKIALPVVSLTPGFAFADNSLAHLVSLDPRSLVKALTFARDMNITGKRIMRRLAESYLRMQEADPNRWERTTVQHRKSMKHLYAMYHVKPSRQAQGILFDGKKTGIFHDIANLQNMTPREAAGTILIRKIPFLVAVSALGAKAKDPDMILALIERMSPTELVTNTKMLERLGVKTNPILKSSYDAGLKRVADSQTATFKTTRAASQQTSAVLKEKLQATQEKQLERLQIEGNWLVLGDRSPSMEESIEGARQVASTLARMVKGSVYLVFFDSTPYKTLDVTGKTYDEVLSITNGIHAGGGGTSIGVGLKYAIERIWDIDGIAIVSDGSENAAPLFHEMHKRYEQLFSKDLPVYLYWVPGSEPLYNRQRLEKNMKDAGRDLQVFDLTKGNVDYHSLPNLVRTMRASRYSLVDEIMETPLLVLKDVLRPENWKEAA